MMRRKLPSGTDVNVFRNTAVIGKKINLGTIIFRGGIRL